MTSPRLHRPGGDRQRHLRHDGAGDNAWLREGEKEKDLLAAMRGGDEMSIHARSRRGNPTSYVFPLDGVTAAVRQMQKECP